MYLRIKRQGKKTKQAEREKPWPARKVLRSRYKLSRVNKKKVQQAAEKAEEY